MFERKLEDATARFYVDEKEARLASEYGIALKVGEQELTYLDAVRLVKQGDKLFPSVPKAQRKRFLALMCSLRTAFGPEFWERYPSPEHLEAVAQKAFLHKTRWA